MANKTSELQNFLAKHPYDNIDWAAQQIIKSFTEEQFLELHACFSKLEETIDKGWAMQMTFEELKKAVDIVAELSNIQTQ